MAGGVGEGEHVTIGIIVQMADIPRGAAASCVLHGDESADTACAFEGAGNVWTPGVAEGIDRRSALADFAAEERPTAPRPNLVNRWVCAIGAANPSEATERIIDHLNGDGWRDE